MVARDDRLLNDLVLRCLPKLVDLAEQRGGFLARHVVRYLERFGRCGDPTLGFGSRCCGALVVSRRSSPFVATAARFALRAVAGRWRRARPTLVDRVLPDVT